MQLSLFKSDRPRISVTPVTLVSDSNLINQFLSPWNISMVCSAHSAGRPRKLSGQSL
jgi:hypothetical protein